MTDGECPDDEDQDERGEGRHRGDNNSAEDAGEDPRPAAVERADVGEKHRSGETGEHAAIAHLGSLFCPIGRSPARRA